MIVFNQLNKAPDTSAIFFEKEFEFIESKKITGKTQIIIPKNYNDYLGMKDSHHTILIPQGIF